MIRVCETGRNPTMRYLGRTHRVSVAWLHERFKSTDYDLVYEVTTRMCADIYTKAFNDKSKWDAACLLIGVVAPARIKELVNQDADSPPQSGGYPTHKQQEQEDCLPASVIGKPHLFAHTEERGC